MMDSSMEVSKFVKRQTSKHKIYGNCTVLLSYSYICTARKSHKFGCLSLFILFILAGIVFLSNTLPHSPTCIFLLQNSDK